MATMRRPVCACRPAPRPRWRLRSGCSRRLRRRSLQLKRPGCPHRRVRRQRRLRLRRRPRPARSGSCCRRSVGSPCSRWTGRGSWCGASSRPTSPGRRSTLELLPRRAQGGRERRERARAGQWRRPVPRGLHEPLRRAAAGAREPRRHGSAGARSAAAAPAVRFVEPDLGPGDRGQSVRLLQSELDALHYAVPLTGVVRRRHRPGARSPSAR